MPIDPKKLVVGDRVPGTKWVVCRKLGVGGMGVVFEVVLPPGVRGAMKIMLPHLATRRDFVESFLGEVRLASSIVHQNIVRVTFFEELEDGTLYYVMELLDGSTLRQTMDLLHGEPLKPAIVYEIVKQVCSGLERAHEAGIVHRDLKPENVFLHAPEGRGDEATVKVGDFGIAVLYRDKRVRGMNGTPKYMAPEQFLDERVSPRTDVYALGLMTYEMLTGRFPFLDQPKDVGALREMHLNSKPIPPSRFLPTLSRELDALLLSAIAKRPEDRPSSAIEYSNRLFELSFCPGLTTTANINATEPTFETLAGLVRRQSEGGGDGATKGGGGGTFQGMTPPPIEGRSLELAPMTSPSTPSIAQLVASQQASVAHASTPTVPSGGHHVWEALPPAPPQQQPAAPSPWPLHPPAAGATSPQARLPSVTARYGTVPEAYTPPLVTPARVAWPQQQSDAGTSLSLAERAAQDPVITISRRAMYRTLIVVPVLAFAAVILVLVLAKVIRDRSNSSNPPIASASAPSAAVATTPILPLQPQATQAPPVPPPQAAPAPVGPAEVASSLVVASASGGAPIASAVPVSSSPRTRRPPMPGTPAVRSAGPIQAAPCRTPDCADGELKGEYKSAIESKSATHPPRDDGRDLLR